MNRNIVRADPVVADNDYPVEKVSDKEAGLTVGGGHSDTDSDHKVETDFQHGVQAVEATTIIWSKRDLIIAYVL